MHGSRIGSNGYFKESGLASGIVNALNVVERPTRFCGLNDCPVAEVKSLDDKRIVLVSVVVKTKLIFGNHTVLKVRGLEVKRRAVRGRR